MWSVSLWKQCCINCGYWAKVIIDRKGLLGLLRQSLTTEQEPKAIVDSTVVRVGLDSIVFRNGSTYTHRSSTLVVCTQHERLIVMKDSSLVIVRKEQERHHFHFQLVLRL